MDQPKRQGNRELQLGAKASRSTALPPLVQQFIAKQARYPAACCREERSITVHHLEVGDYLSLLPHETDRTAKLLPTPVQGTLLDENLAGGSAACDHTSEPAWVAQSFGRVTEHLLTYYEEEHRRTNTPRCWVEKID